MRYRKKLIVAAAMFRLFPHLLVYFASDRAILDRDIERWASVQGGGERRDSWGKLRYLVLLLAFQPEFRSLFYFRLPASKIFRILLPGASALFFDTDRIGPGLFLQHAFSTIIAAGSIGQNCWINQQVTIGYSGPGKRPTIGNNVSIKAGAKVLGAITIGDNVTIGANAVVVKDVPANCVVVGVPAYIVRRDGKRVTENL